MGTKRIDSFWLLMTYGQILVCLVSAISRHESVALNIAITAGCLLAAVWSGKDEDTPAPISDVEQTDESESGKP